MVDPRKEIKGIPDARVVYVVQMTSTQARRFIEDKLRETYAPNEHGIQRVGPFRFEILDG